MVLPQSIKSIHFYNCSPSGSTFTRQGLHNIKHQTAPMSSSLTGSTTLKSSITPVIIYFLQSEQFLPGQCLIICSQDSFLHLRIFKTNHHIIHFSITSSSPRFSRQSFARTFYTKFLYPYATSTSPAKCQVL